MPAEAILHPEVLVSADWVAEHLDDPKVRIVESDEDVLLYDMGHIPGSVKIDWQGDLQDQLIRDYIDADKFAAICSKAGIAQRHHRRLLRRQVELVGLLRLLGVQALRPRGLPDPERRPEALDRPEAADDHRGPELPADQVHRRRRDESAIRAFRDEVLAHFEVGQAAARRPEPEGVHRRADPHGGLSPGRLAPGRPHPGRSQRPLGPRRQRRRDVQVGRRADGDLSRARSA